MRDYSVNDFELVTFFSYTSTIPYNDTICEVDMNNFTRYPNLCEKFDIFYRGLIDTAIKFVKEKTGNDMSFRFMDNKTVFQIRRKYSGRTYFIGRYDGRRAIGTSCILYDGIIFDFKNIKMSDYVSDIVCDGRWLWKRYDSVENL